MGEPTSAQVTRSQSPNPTPQLPLEPTTPPSRRCSNCGGEKISVSARRCHLCGNDEQSNTSSMVSVSPTQPRPSTFDSSHVIERYQRPTWLVILLSVVTFDLYLPIWLAATWADIKREPVMRGEKLYPIWHGLTFFVPIYGIFRLHAHYRTIGELLNREGDFRIYAKSAATCIVVGVVVVGVLGDDLNITETLWVNLLLWIAPSFIFAGVIAYGQRFLNTYFKMMAGKNIDLPNLGQVAPNRVFWWEWLLLIIGAIATLLFLSSLFTS